jgi:hypothetical protein
MAITGSVSASPPPPPPPLHVFSARAQLGAQNRTASSPAQDPVVAAKIEDVRKRIDFSPEPGAATAYAISQVMADKTMTKAQKEDFVASLVEMSAGKTTAYGGANKNQDTGKDESKAIARAFAEIGTAWSGDNTPALRDAVAKTIGDATTSRRLDADDLHGLFSPNENDQGNGVRSLLTEIKDGKVLNSLADKLANEAVRSGFDINKYQPGVSQLIAAADVANMAAKHGSPAAADKIVSIIDAQTNKGPVAGKMTLVDAMQALGTQTGLGNGAIPGRTGLDALSGLLTSAKTGEATDRLFAGLVRSTSAGSVLSRPATDPSGALGDIGKYFDKNAARLVEADWTHRNTGPDNMYQGLTKDVIRTVVYNKDYEGAVGTADAMAKELKRLSGIVQDTSRSDEVRKAAANSLGTLSGSLKSATEKFIKDEGEQAKSLTAGPAYFANLLVSKLGSNAGPAGKAVGFTGDKLIDAAVAAYVSRAEDKAKSTANQLTGDVTNLGFKIREAMADLKIGPDVMLAFDTRFDFATK